VIEAVWSAHKSVFGFLAEDPLPLSLRAPRDAHSYTYTANDAVNNSDPFGMAAWTVFGNYRGFGGSGSPLGSGNIRK
jgi:hypothetical protein